MRADILLATYNGARFLEAQLASIIGQTHTDWKLYARDDGSTDGTRDLLQKFEQAHPGKITVVRDDLGGLGATGNFSRLMAFGDAPYIFFSDQDDAWEPDKLAVMLAAIRKSEPSPEVPVLVFSDLAVINDAGEEVAPSLWARENVDPSRTALNQLLVQNIPYGCASVVNRALLELARPVDGRALLHDHWMALLAAASGVIAPYRGAPIKHRIHDANASRSNSPIRKARDRSALARLANRNFNRYFGQLQSQAAAVKERLLERDLGNGPCDVLDDFVNLRRKGLLARKYLMVKRRFFKHSRSQSLKWLIRI